MKLIAILSLSLTLALPTSSDSRGNRGKSNPSGANQNFGQNAGAGSTTTSRPPLSFPTNKLKPKADDDSFFTAHQSISSIDGKRTAQVPKSASWGNWLYAGGQNQGSKSSSSSLPATAGIILDESRNIGGADSNPQQKSTSISPASTGGIPEVSQHSTGTLRSQQMQRDSSTGGETSARTDPESTGCLSCLNCPSPGLPSCCDPDCVCEGVKNCCCCPCNSVGAVQEYRRFIREGM